MKGEGTEEGNEQEMETQEEGKEKKDGTEEGSEQEMEIDGDVGGGERGR